MVFGGLMAFFNHTSLFQPLDRVIDSVFWPHEDPPQAFLEFKRWVYGAWGATLMGLGILIIFVAAVPLRRGERWSWWALTSMLVVWYLLDTGISLYHGVIANAGLNTVFLVFGGLPLWFLRGDYVKRGP